MDFLEFFFLLTDLMVEARWLVKLGLLSAEDIAIYSWWSILVENFVPVIMDLLYDMYT